MRFTLHLLVGLILITGCSSVHDAKAPADASMDSGPASDEAGVEAGAMDGGEMDSSSDGQGSGGGDDGGSDDAGSGPGDLSECEQQIEDSLDGLPEDVACLGLYSDVRTKVIEESARSFAPAIPLWSDGSGKQRWFYLPEGEKIDATAPSDWVFPVGTKFFKEFRVNGRRIETRIFQKTRDDRWVRGTYEWNRDETFAKRSFGSDREDILINGAEYHVPSGRECDQCHGGRKDRVLGFEAASLGTEGAQGITLQDLVDEELIEPPPARTQLTIGDDGTGLAAPVLGWLHINCGVSCHNDNQNAEAYSSGLRMKLYVNELDGRRVDGFDAITTTVGVTAKTTRFGDLDRIVEGLPDQSLLYMLATSRGGDERDQMPPIATNVVPSVHVAEIRDWIIAMDPDAVPAEPPQP